MTLPTSNVVDVSIAVGAPFPARAGFGTLTIVTNETGYVSIAERIRSYSNLDGVAADWPANSKVVAAATSYFSQNPRPTKLKVAVRFDNDQSAQLRGGSVPNNAGSLAIFTPISDGSFSIGIDAVTYNITGLDFSSETTLPGVAGVINTALVAALAGTTCTYDGSRFFVASPTNGIASTISFLTPVAPVTGTDVSSLLQMRQGEGTKTNGIDAETVSASLTAIQDRDSDWYGLVFTKEVRDGISVNGEDAIVAAAAWCEARVKIFFNTSNDLDVLDPVTINDIASTLRNSGYRRTMTTFSSYPEQYPSASIAGRAFTVNFSQPNSTITLKFKQMPGITVEDLTQSEKDTLDSKLANTLVSIGGSDMFAESWTAGNVFLDEIHGLDWLQNAIQTNVFGYLLTRPTKVPYTDRGIASIQQQVIRACDEGVNNGLLAPGTTLDGEFLGTGYQINTLPEAEVNQSDKEARSYPGVSGILLGAGAIHRVQVNLIFER